MNRKVNELKYFNENNIDKDYLYLKKEFNLLMEKYNKKSKRLDKIIKQGDKQQHVLLNQKIAIDALHAYDIEQQNIAKEKLNSAIVNDFLDDNNDINTDVIFKASDILSGDFYSIHKLKNNAQLIYVIDGQGHGISPALTVFAVSSAIMHIIEEHTSFKNIVNKLFPMIQKFLGEIEQLSYTILYIDENKNNLQYISGGMYPFLINHNNTILKYKANNLPFMNFSSTPIITEINLKKWNSILIYTDGLVEDLTEDMKQFSPLAILENEKSFTDIKDSISDKKFEDDITVVKIINK